MAEEEAEVQIILVCPECGDRFSTDPHDYWLNNPDERITCQHYDEDGILQDVICPLMVVTTTRRTIDDDTHEVIRRYHTVSYDTTIGDLVKAHLELRRRFLSLS